MPSIICGRLYSGCTRNTRPTCMMMKIAKSAWQMKCSDRATCGPPNILTYHGKRERIAGAIAKPVRIISGASTNTTARSEEHTSELQSRFDLVCRLLLEKKKKV